MTKPICLQIVARMYFSAYHRHNMHKNRGHILDIKFGRQMLEVDDREIWWS
jgi:hypothetical protein